MRNPNLFPSVFSDHSTRTLFDRLNNEIARVFNDFDTTPHALQNDSVNESMLTAKMDYSETDDTVEVKVDIPGFKEEDIDVELNGRMLSISGKRETKTDDKKKDYRIIERESGSFTRRLNLDFDADPDKINAQVDAGILTLTIEKPEEKKSKKQKITVKPKSDS